MRALAAALLNADGPLPRFDELADRTAQLRRHLRDMIPRAEDAARAFPHGNVDGAVARSAVVNARVQLAADPGPGLVSATQYARSLARELRGLCDLYDTLTLAPAGDER